MNDTLKLSIVTFLGIVITSACFWVIVRHENKLRPEVITSIQADSVAQAKEALKSPIIQGKVAATIEHCKLYELKTENGDLIYWSICYDKDMRISTSVTMINKK